MSLCVAYRTESSPRGREMDIETKRGMRRSAGDFVSGPRLAPTSDNVLIAGEFRDADRAACVKAISRDADFRAHAEFAAICELSRRVV